LRADFLAGDDLEVEAGFGIFLCLTGEGHLVFNKTEKLSVKAGDAVVIPHSAGGFKLNGCKGIISRPPAA
jgi:mannose-6-phosphate isomerase